MTKKIVHYDKRMGAQEVAFGRVILYPIDHPDTENVSNTTLCYTSKVVDWNKDNGIIETQNTIYVPH